MANPQNEDGYTKIANELLDAIVAFRIAGEVRQVFDAIIRKTYGFNKKEDALANSQIVEITKMKKSNVSRSLSTLINHKLVIKTDNNDGKGNILKINKDYSQWIPFGIKSDTKKKKPKKLSKLIRKVSKVITPVIRSDDKRLSEVMDTKDKRNTKDTIQKTGKDIEQARWARDIIEAFSKINPAMKKMYGNTNQRKACVDLVEEYGFERVLFVVEMTLPKTNPHPFFPTIMTPVQLFHEYSRLENAIEKHKNKAIIKQQEKGKGLA